LHGTDSDEVGMRAGVEFGDGGGIGGDQECLQTVALVVEPRAVGVVDCRGSGAFVEASVREVGIDDGAVANAQGEARFAFPFVGEAVHAGEFGCSLSVTNEHAERAAGFDRGQLRPVAHQQYLRARCGGLFDDASRVWVPASEASSMITSWFALMVQRSRSC
jgi:hypothetical protein